MVLGASRVGKSTLINCLAGNRLIAREIAATGELEIFAPSPIPNNIIGNSLASETFLPQKWVDGEVVYWDCPSFYDNRGIL